jgi:halimadienyl-diphosphate synthase
MEDFYDLLKTLGTTRISNTAYDTAWVARLNEFAPDISNPAMDWISKNQLPDGSWGAQQPFYYHDRLLATLSAMVVLTRRGRRGMDKLQVEKGIESLRFITAGATQGLMADPNGATVGFELIAPTLVAEAEQLGLITQQKEHILGRLGDMRVAKLAKLAGHRISRFTSVSHSAEMTGEDNVSLLDIENLQEENGSIGVSPAATAYFALYVKPGDEKALNYLRSFLQGRNGGAPTVFPIETFEIMWALWNLCLTGLHKTDTKIKALCLPHLDYLETCWKPGEGMAFTGHFTPADGDDTNVGFEILSKFGRNPKMDAVLSYEEEKWFRCFAVERDPSVGANVHAIGALRQAGYDKNHPSVKKLLSFIWAMRHPGGYWLDKWNISPYYITAHIVILCKGYDDELCQEAVNWILSRQHADGSWASYNFPTAEETAYCIQALKIWQIYGGKIPKGRLEQARQWLSTHCEPPYPLLWIGKSVYCPEIVTKSTIISALILAEG